MVAEFLYAEEYPEEDDSWMRRLVDNYVHPNANLLDASSILDPLVDEMFRVDVLKVINENGKTLSFGQMKYNVTSRGGKGVKTSQRTSIAEVIPEELTVVDWSNI